MLLQRTRILANQRLDLVDYNNIEDFGCADFKAIHKNIWTNQNFVFSGFSCSGVGTNTLSIVQAGSSFVIGQDDGVLYIGAPSLSPIATTNLAPGTTNYVELFADQNTGGADSRAFWDPTAAGGAGAEFSQIVDTFIFLEATLSVSTSNFSGDPDKVKICEVDVNGSGVITAIRDRRDMFFRLGRGTNVSFAFPWASRVEPADTQFTGADKDIKNLKQWADAVMDGLREVKGTNYWYEQAAVTIGGSFQNVGLSLLTGANNTAKFSWSGTQLSITDDDVSPSDSDILAYLRLVNSTTNLQLTRQELGNAISIADGQALWIEIPNPLANVIYDGVGATASNYRVTARGSVPLNENVYWLAFREGAKLYLRGLGDLEPGEEKEVNDETPEALKTFLGFDPETATSVPYTATPDVGLPGQFTTADTLVTAISANAENINFLDQYLAAGPYEEPMTVVAGAPANDNEVTGPVVASTVLALPLDSRDGNSTQSYVVGAGQLQVYLNGDYLLVGEDWLEVGIPGNTSTTIQINIGLVVGDRLTFRLSGAGGVFVTGGATSLQDAYNGGSIITALPGIPFQVNGTGKVAQFNGDIGVTGVIDPAGITFSREGSDPLSGIQDGLWANSTGQLIYKRQGFASSNLSELLAYLLATAETNVPYSFTPNGDLPGSFTTSDTLVEAISQTVRNVNHLDDLLATNPYEEFLTVVAGAPADDNEVTGPVSISTMLTLPVDSRDSDSVENYVVGQGQLQVYLNGDYLAVGEDWLEVGTIDTASSTIQINVALEIGDRLIFRSALSGGIVTSGGGGGGGSLQDAFDTGNTITTTPGNPLIVGGTASKVAVFNGDIDVTGIIDPKGITFSREGSNPIPSGMDGLWCNSSGELVHSVDGSPDSNITQIITGGLPSGALEVTLENQSGSSLPKFTPVMINSSGYLDMIDVSVEADADSVVGIVSSDIADATQGSVMCGGKLLDVATSAVLGDAVYVAKSGGVTATKPSIGVEGFVSGDFVIRLGVIARNVTTPSLKDLVVNISIVGQL